MHTVWIHVHEQIHSHKTRTVALPAACGRNDSSSRAGCANNQRHWRKSAIWFNVVVCNPASTFGLHQALLKHCTDSRRQNCNYHFVNGLAACRCLRISDDQCPTRGIYPSNGNKTLGQVEKPSAAPVYHLQPSVCTCTGCGPVLSNCELPKAPANNTEQQKIRLSLRVPCPRRGLREVRHVTLIAHLIPYDVRSAVAPTCGFSIESKRSTPTTSFVRHRAPKQ